MSEQNFGCFYMLLDDAYEVKTFMASELDYITTFNSYEIPGFTPLEFMNKTIESVQPDSSGGNIMSTVISEESLDIILLSYTIDHQSYYATVISDARVTSELISQALIFGWEVDEVIHDSFLYDDVSRTYQFNSSVLPAGYSLWGGDGTGGKRLKYKISQMPMNLLLPDSTEMVVDGLLTAHGYVVGYMSASTIMMFMNDGEGGIELVGNGDMPVSNMNDLIKYSMYIPDEDVSSRPFGAWLTGIDGVNNVHLLVGNFRYFEDVYRKMVIFFTDVSSNLTQNISIESEYVMFRDVFIAQGPGRDYLFNQDALTAEVVSDYGKLRVNMLEMPVVTASDIESMAAKGGSADAGIAEFYAVTGDPGSYGSHPALVLRIANQFYGVELTPINGYYGYEPPK